MKFKLLDLFCGGGGAGEGYHRAGFEVVGVDIAPHKNYPYEFHLCDWKEFLRSHWNEFDVVHASPPCQEYSRLKCNLTDRRYGKLIDQVRAELISTGKFYIIENVECAPLKNPFTLAGSMFGLGVNRRRLFESNFFLMTPKYNRYAVPNYVPVYGKGFNLGVGKKAIGIDRKITKRELAESIPPAYTEYIGRELISILNQVQNQRLVRALT